MYQASTSSDDYRKGHAPLGCGRRHQAVRGLRGYRTRWSSGSLPGAATSVLTRFFSVKTPATPATTASALVVALRASNKAGLEVVTILESELAVHAPVRSREDALVKVPVA